jgi:hypothetical protein
MKRFLLERFASMTFHFEEVLEHQLSTLISWDLVSKTQVSLVGQGKEETEWSHEHLLEWNSLTCYFSGSNLISPCNRDIVSPVLCIVHGVPYWILSAHDESLLNCDTAYWCRETCFPVIEKDVQAEIRVVIPKTK